MKPINRKEVVVGSMWELRAKLTQATYENYKAIKSSYQNKHNKTYSDSAFLAVLMKDLVTVNEMTP